MPAVKYDYEYYNQNERTGRGVAKSARSVSASSNMSAQRKVSTNTSAKRNTTSASTKNSTRAATRNVSSTATKKVSTPKKIQHTDIDIPITVKKKVVIDKPEEMKLTRPKTKSKSKAKVEELKKKIVLSVFVVATLFAVCMRYTQINEKFNQVNSLEKKLASVEALNQQLNANLESKTDLNYIEKYAKYQLGMQKPDDSQIVRIAYEKHDKISTPIVIEEEIEKSFVEKLLNDIKNLID